MFFTTESFAANRNIHGHWDDLWAVRNMMSAEQRSMVAVNRAMMTQEMAANAAVGYPREFWQEVDRQIVQLRDQEVGMEIVNDLMQVQTALPIGKTSKAYNIVGEIADDVVISMDGQAPFSFDHTDYDSDADPIPIFLAGYGVNWRHAAGLSTVGIDLALDSQAAKMRVYNKALVSYSLTGSSRITVNQKQGQGLKNHRNTKKINLGSGAGGVNINLVTADAEALLGFFGQNGAFGAMARANRVPAYDVLWVSYEIWANFSRPYLININSGTNGVIGGNVLSAVLPFAPIKEVRPTYALSGNEFIAYQRRQDVVTPLVGMTTGVTPLPRTMPNHNYNFQIMGAMGVQVKRDGQNLSGVLYGANLA